MRPEEGHGGEHELYGAPSRWRLQVLDAILRTLSVLGLVALLLTTPVMFADGQVALGLGYWFFWAVVVAATMWRSLGYTLRLSVLLGTIYLIAVAVALGEHRVPEFAVYMVAVPTLAALLGGMRWGVASLVACAATLLGVAVLAVRGQLPPAPATATALDHVGNWITFGANWALMAALVGVSIWFVVARLEDSLAQAEALTDDLERQIEARRETQSQLVQAQKMEAVGQLAGGVAHDFNNLLTVINFGISDALEGDDPEQRETSLKIVRDSAVQAERLVRQLLHLSRRDVAQPRTLEVNELVEGTAAVIARLVPAGIRVETALSPEVGRVFMDDVALRQVLLNLCLNARDAMLGGGRIVLRTKLHDGPMVGAKGGVVGDGAHAVIEVADDGPGVPREAREEIFEAFVTTKPKGKGTGLGLSTSLHIVEEAGGTLTVDDAPGGGASFRVVLPTQSGSMVNLERHVTAPSLPPGLRILVVDDDPGVRSVLESTLRSAGAHVRQETSVEAVLEAPERLDEIDALVTDVVLGGARGTQLATLARTRRSRFPVIYCSGYAPDDQVQADVTAGIAGFVQKPFDRRRLLDAVAEQVQREGRDDDHVRDDDGRGDAAVP